METPQKNSEIRDSLSLVSFHIEFFFRGASLGFATAFIYAHHDNELYLITNWHCVTGREPSGRHKFKPKHSSSALPDRLSIQIPVSDGSDGNHYNIGWEKAEILLYTDAEESETPDFPIWFEHPKRNEVDVVAIPINESNCKPLADLFYVDAPPHGVLHDVVPIKQSPSMGLAVNIWATAMMKLFPGMDVFILGFPFGISGGEHYPIWKRGSIASEPDIDIDDLPKFFVDTATSEGMSGSPVVAQGRDWIHERTNVPSLGSLGRKFAGVYSGRIVDSNPETQNDLIKAQIGIVWKPSVIEEIIESETLGKASHKYTAIT